MKSCSAGSGPDPQGEMDGRLRVLLPKYECGEEAPLASGGELGESVIAHLEIPVPI